MEGSEEHSQKAKNKSTLPPIPHLGIRQMDSTPLHRHLLSHVHCCSFHKAREWRQTKWPSTNEWIMKMLYTYITVYYEAIEKNEIQKVAHKWMKLEHNIPRLWNTNIVCSHSCEAPSLRLSDVKYMSWNDCRFQVSKKEIIVRVGSNGKTIEKRISGYKWSDHKNRKMQKFYLRRWEKYKEKEKER